MFFVLSKILDLFLQPICWIIVLLIVSYFTKSKKVRKISFSINIFLILLLTNGKFTNFFYNSWEIQYPPKNNQTYQLGVVLTGGIIQSNFSHDSTIHFASQSDRLMQAIILYKQGIIKKIIISGGNVSIAGNLINDFTRESYKSEQFLKMVGIPDSCIIIENKSRNTRENALFSKRMLTNLKLENKKIALITSAYHMKRSAACFTKVSITFDMFPAIKQGKDTSMGILSDFVPDELNLYLNASLIHEIVGYYIYKLMGYC